jgi:anti-sigma factor RsiW
MDSTTHPFAREEVMAYLDGELAPERAAAAAAHLEQCAECRALAADLRAVSRQMPEWEVEAIPTGMQQRVLLATEQEKVAKAPVIQEEQPPRSRRRGRLLIWGAAFSGAMLVLYVFSISGPRYSLPQKESGLSAPLASASSSYVNRESPNAPGPPPVVAPRDQASRAASAMTMAKKAPAPIDAIGPLAADKAQAGESGPMIVRRASLAVLTKEFDAARSALENLVKAHQGYFGELNVATPASAGRSLAATVRVPAAQLDAVLVELRKLGHVENENQSADDVTREFADLSARLANARETEKRLVEILRERTGKVSDVLQVEQQIARTRQQIEQMDAERKTMESQVRYASVDLRITEEYKQSLETPAPSLGTRINNAAVEGFRSAAELILGLLLWLLSSGPTLVVVGAVLAWPTWWLVRLVRRRYFAQAAPVSD